MPSHLDDVIAHLNRVETRGPQSSLCEGRIEIDNLDILTHRLEVQARLGYLPENTPLYPELSVRPTWP